MPQRTDASHQPSLLAFNTPPGLRSRKRAVQAPPFDARAAFGVDLPAHQSLVIVPEGAKIEPVCAWCGRRMSVARQKVDMGGRPRSCEAQPEQPRKRSSFGRAAVPCVQDHAAVACAPFTPPVPDLAALRVGDDVHVVTQYGYEVRVLARVLWVGEDAMVAATDRIAYRGWPTRTQHGVPILGAQKNFDLSVAASNIAHYRALNHGR